MQFGRLDRIPIEVAIPEVYINPADIARLEDYLRKAPNFIREAYDRACFRFARQVLAIVRKAIRTGVPPPGGGVNWKPLSEKTIKAYTRWGHPNAHPWYVIGQMSREVNIFKSNKNRSYVGFPRGMTARHPNPNYKRGNRPTLAALANFLENQHDVHYPRPLFNPAFKSAGGKERLSKFVVQDIRRTLNQNAPKNQYR